jgi:uncharacterized lipoprotein YmbA
MRAILAIRLAVTLAACASTAPNVRPSLLTCAQQPKSPVDQAGATQRDVALWIVDMAAAGDDCRSKLGSVRRIVSPENAR